jgi:hypothetical protein
MEDVYRQIMRGKKRPDQLEDAEKNAMMGVLKDIHGMASDDMGHDIKGMKKVSVASNSTNGLKAGLDKAKGMIQDQEHGTMNDEDAEESSHKMRNPSENQLDHSKKKDEVSDEWPEQDTSEHDLPEMRGKEDDADHLGRGAANGTKSHRYARGGMVPDVDEAEHMADAHGAEKQWFERHGDDSAAAMPTIAKEKDNRADPMGRAKAAYAKGGEVMGTIGQGTHGTHGPVDPADEYSDLEPEELEMLIKHLMAKRKS